MRKGPMVLSLAVAGLSLAACNQQAGQNAVALATGAPIASLPLAEGAPPPLIAAPALASLPSAPPVQVVRAPARERYRYIDRAEALGSAFADSPPDYTVDYASVRPWIWRSNRGEYRVVEPTPEGERTYYFDAGSDQPFLVSDPEYSYGYDHGALAVIYTSDGRPAEFGPDSADRAARYLARARALYAAAVHQQRQAAYAEAWRQRRAEVLAEQQAWAADQQRDAEWSDWRQSHQRAEQADWDRERAMRVAYAATAVAAVVSAVQSDHSRPPAGERQQFGPPPGQPGGSPSNQGAPGGREDHQAFQPGGTSSAGQQFSAQAQALRDAQAKAAGQQAQSAELAQARRQGDAARAAQVDAARKDQLQAAQLTAAKQQADAARGAQAQAARQVDVARLAQTNAAQAAARQQADAARAAQAQAARQADVARLAQANAAQAAARQQADAARMAQAQAVRQADAAHLAQANAAQAAARQQADASRAAQADAAHRAQLQAQTQAHGQAQQAAAAQRGDAIKAKLALLQAEKTGKPDDKKDHGNQN